MMRKSNYYLVVKRRNGEDFEIVSLDGIEGNQKSLAAIDLYTTSFKTKAELIMNLYDKKIIDQFDVDIFIVKRSNCNLSFLEVIYGKDNYYVEGLRNIAWAEQQGKMNLEIANADSILDDFCRKVYLDDNFSEMVTCGVTDIYKKFVDYFKRNFSSLRAMCGVKYLDGNWARKSYPLIRNVVESFTRYERIYKGCFYNLDQKRKEISEKLLFGTERETFVGQMSLFDDTEEKAEEDRLTEVLDMIQKLPKGAIKEENGGIVFNDRIFVYYENSLYRERLITFFKPVGRILYHYLYDGAENLQGNLKKIGKQLNEDSTFLNDMYSFCKLYYKCYEDDYEYRRLHGMLGDGYGKVFKRQENH